MIELGLTKRVIVYNYPLRMAFNFSLLFVLDFFIYEGISCRRWAKPVQIMEDIHVDVWTDDVIDTRNFAEAYRHKVGRQAMCVHIQGIMIPEQLEVDVW